MKNKFFIVKEDDAEVIDKAIKERDNYINSLPYDRRVDAFAIQQKIDDQLKKANTQHNRLSMIGSLMMESFLKLNKVLQELKKETEVYATTTKKE